MNCPYCSKVINAFTGLQELQKFEKHLVKCRKNPNNIVIKGKHKTVVVPLKKQTMEDSLNIRYESGQ